MPAIRYILISIAIPLILGIAPPKGPTDMGNDALVSGNPKEALEFYRNALEDDPESPEAYYNLGNAYYRLGSFDAALAAYLKAASLDPEMADAFYNSGNASFRMNKFEDALKLYERADGLRPDDPDTLYNIELTKKIIEEMKLPKTGGGGGKGDGEGDRDKEENKEGEGENGDGGLGVGRREVNSMSGDEIQKLLDKQASEEKRMRGYFKPGRVGRRSESREELERKLEELGIQPEQPAENAPPSGPEKDW